MSTNSSAQGAANSSDKVFNDSLFQCVKRRCSRRLWILNARKLLYTSGTTFVALSMSTVAVDSIYAVINTGGGHHVPRYLPSLLVAIVATVTTTALTSRILKLRKGYCVGGLDVFVMEVLKGLAAWSWVGLLESCVLQFDGNNNNDDGNDDGGGSGGGGSGSDDDDDDEGSAGHLSNLKKLKTVVAVLGIALALTPFYLGGARVGREVLGASERVKVKLNSFEVTVWSYVLGFSTHLFFRTLVAGVLFKRTMYLSGLVGLVFFLELFVAGRFIVEMQERATRLAPESRAYALPSCLVAFDLLCESLSVTVAFACLSQFHALYGLLLFTCLGNEAPLVDDTVWVDLSSADDSYGADDVDREGGDFGKRGDDVVTGPQVLLGVAWLASAFCSSLLVYTFLAATALGPAPLPEVTTTTTILTPAEGGGRGGGGGSGSDGGSGVGVRGSYCCCHSDSSSSSSSSSSSNSGNGNGNGGRDRRQRRQGGGGGGGRFEERAALVVIGSSNYHDDDDGGGNAGGGGGGGGDSGFHGSDNGDSYEEENEDTGIGEQDDDRYDDEDGNRGDDNEDEDAGGRALWARARRDTLRRRNALLLNAAALAVGYCGSKFLGLAVALTFASSSTSSTSSSIGALLLRFSAAVSVASLLALAHARQRIFRERQAAAAATTLSSNRQHLHPFHYDLEDGADDDLERQLRDATTQFAMLQDHLLSLQQDDSNSGLNATWSSAVSSSSNGHHPHRPQSKKRRLRRQRFGYMEGDDEDALSEDEDDFEELFDDGLADEEAAADAEKEAEERGRLSLADDVDEAEGSDVDDEGDDDDDDSDGYDSFGSSRGGVRSSDDDDDDDDDNAVAGMEERNGGASNSREYYGVDEGGGNGEQERSGGTRVGKDEGQGHTENGEGNGEEDVDASVRSNQWRHEESGMSLQRPTTTTSDLSGGVGGGGRSGQSPHSSLGRSSSRGIGSQLLAAPLFQGEWL